jgi:MoaA/NifB/PqqE/SkfB family radical SAM enzyme
MAAKDPEIKLSFNRNYYKFMQWDITQHCNLRCAHCRSTEFYSQSKNIDLPLDVNRRIAEELYVNGVRRIHFLGGEPLFRKDFCDFVEYLDSIGMEWSVNTNATLLTEKVAKRLLDARARVITISLDGPDAESNDAIRGSGVFDKVCENTVRLTHLRDRRRSNTRVVISCTVVRQSTGHMGAMTDLAHQLGVNSLILSSLRLMGRAKESVCDLGVDFATELGMGEEVACNIAAGKTQHIQLGFLTPVAIQYLNEEYGTAFPFYDASCNAVIQKGYIQPDGALFPCQSLTDSAEIPKAIGPLPRRSLSDHSFDEIWNSKEMRRIGAALFGPKIGESMLPCRYCRYFRVLCYPCPLGELGGKRSINYACLEAMTKLAERRGYDVPWRGLLNEMKTKQEQTKEVKTS